MSWVAVAIGVSAGISIMGNNAKAANEQAVLEKQKYDMRVQASFNEESLKSDLIDSELDFGYQFGQRLDGYNTVRNNQLVSAGYQMRTADSFNNIQKADDYNMDYDNKVADLNLHITKSTLKINNAMKSMGLQSDIQSASAAQSASKSANTWSALNTLVSAGATYKMYKK